MVSTSLTPAQAARAAQHIATLRGLYGDLGDALNDPGLRRELFGRILSEQKLLASLLRPTPGSQRAG